MEDIIITGTKHTPDIHFKADGNFVISGRSIPEDPNKFYEPLYDWVYEYCLSAHPHTILKIHLEYFNSGSSKALLNIIKALADMSNKEHKLTVLWHYEKDDEDIIERGEYIESLVNVPFEYVEVV